MLVTGVNISSSQEHILEFKDQYLIFLYLLFILFICDIASETLWNFDILQLRKTLKAWFYVLVCHLFDRLAKRNLNVVGKLAGCMRERISLSSGI